MAHRGERQCTEGETVQGCTEGKVHKRAHGGERRGTEGKVHGRWCTEGERCYEMTPILLYFTFITLFLSCDRHVITL